MKTNGTAEKVSSKIRNEEATGAKTSRLEELLHEELKDIYWAEKHLIRTLPKFEKAANSDVLKETLAEHLEQTREHVERLEKVFELMGKKPEAKKCDGMEGLTKEGESIIEETEGGTATRDVGLILAAQKVEHYEIATYGTLSRLARVLHMEEVAEILEKTLNEEKVADMNLTQVAENDVNYESGAEPAE